MTNNRQPPSSIYYNLFLPPGDNPRCTTYIRKDIGLNTRYTANHQQCILSVTIDILDSSIEIINVCVPTRNEVNALLDTHKPKTKTFIGGDCNAHHTMWYGNIATDRTELIKNSWEKAQKLVHHIQELGLTLQNTPNEFTHFSGAERYKNSIPDLTLTSGHVTTITGGWSCGLEGSGNSDYALITTNLHIKTPAFTPRKVFRLTDWGKFDKVISTTTIAEGT